MAEHLNIDVPPTGPRIEIGICTFRRPQVVQTLHSLRALEVPPGLRLSLIVIDNDDTPTARDAVTEIARQDGIPIFYRHAPKRNISIARNALLSGSDADWIGFVDDDETVAEDWLAQHWARQAETGADGIFGPAKAIFPSNAPNWMIELDMHTPTPKRRNGEIQTGSAGNFILRWQGTPWSDQLFEIGRGRTGGEDTEFFFRLRGLGARYEFAEQAVTFEPVAPDRLSLRWLRRRRFRAGQSYSSHATDVIARIRLAAVAACKSLFSIVMTIAMFFSPAGWRYWFLRATFHAGVIAGCLRIKEAELYG